MRNKRRAVISIIDDIKFEHHPTLRVRLGVDHLSSTVNGGFVQWIQLVDDALDPSFNSGRKWRLSEHMTDSEVVGTVFAAYKAWLEHEMMESFTYMGVKVFDPHVSIEARVRMAADPANYEYRS